MSSNLHPMLNVAIKAARTAGTIINRAALDLVLPMTGFDGAPAQSPGLNAAAWRKITFVCDPACDGCGRPFEYETGARCPACQAQPAAFARARAACDRGLAAMAAPHELMKLERLIVQYLDDGEAAALRASLGLDQPLPLQYARFVGRALQGEFGMSYRNLEPVSALIASRVPSQPGAAYLPVSTPPPSGDQGHTPLPISRAIGTSSRSTVRSMTSASMSAPCEPLVCSRSP